MIGLCEEPASGTVALMLPSCTKGAPSLYVPRLSLAVIGELSPIGVGSKHVTGTNLFVAENTFVAPFAGQVGDRIELVSLAHDGHISIPRGATGTIIAAHRVYCDDTVQVLVRWDIGCSLSLIWPLDKFRIVQRRAAA